MRAAYYQQKWVRVHALHPSPTGSWEDRSPRRRRQTTDDFYVICPVACEATSCSAPCGVQRRLVVLNLHVIYDGSLSGLHAGRCRSTDGGCLSLRRKINCFLQMYLRGVCMRAQHSQTRVIVALYDRDRNSVSLGQGLSGPNKC